MKLLVDVALNNRVMKLLVDVALKFLNLCTAMVVMVANIASYPGPWPPTKNLGTRLDSSLSHQADPLVQDRGSGGDPQLQDGT